MRYKLTVPARAAALPVLLVLAGCGASEPQLPCSEVYQKVRLVGRQLDRDDRDMVNLSPQPGRYAAEMCPRAKAWMQQQKELLKLVRDNKDRCKEYDFSSFNIGAMSLDQPGRWDPFIESAACK